MFVARQPIFNRRLSTYGYELLHRTSKDSAGFGNVSDVKATADVLGDLFEKGIEDITNNLLAFVNFDHELLLSDLVELIDPQHLVVEILEDVKIDKTLIIRIEELKAKGYKIALDDFEEDYETYPITYLADIIKYDITNTPLKTIRSDVKKGLMDNKILLAEKVETREQYKEAKKMGFHLFQGYFFSKPEIISKSISRKSTKLQYARLINELGRPEPSYQTIAEIIESDVNLSYRLMKVIGHRTDESTIISIRRALVYMGIDEIGRWINILMLQELTVDKPLELMSLSLVRAKFGESIAVNSKFKDRKLEISLMCLFSTLDAILDEPMEEALDGILLADDIKEALIYRKGEFSTILNLIDSYEKGDWAAVNHAFNKLDIDNKKAYTSYLSAIRRSNEILEYM